MKNDKYREQEHCSLLTAHFESSVFSILEKYKNTVFLAAISGGADSMALLFSLYSSALSVSSVVENIHVLHVDHGLRGQESKDDAEFVRAFCGGLSTGERSIPCTIVTIPEGEVLAYAKAHNTGVEAAARHFRREALLNEARRLDSLETDHSPENGQEPKTLILTAHTKDDALELALIRILRGAGPEGLSAMPVKRGRFVRPLLGVTRAEIIAYLKEKNIPWREDSSNTDEKFLRNKIRHKLIPFLDELFQQKPSRGGAKTQSLFNWKKGITEIAATQSLVSEFISSEAEKRIVWEQVIGSKEQLAVSSLFTDENNFFLQSQIIREEAIFFAIDILRGLCAAVPACAGRPPCEKIPKRYVIRQFCEGNQKAADLGSAYIVRKKGKIIISPGLERKRKYWQKPVKTV